MKRYKVIALITIIAAFINLGAAYMEVAAELRIYRDHVDMEFDSTGCKKVYPLT